MTKFFRLSFLATLLLVLAACSQNEQLPSAAFIQDADEAEVSNDFGDEAVIAELTSNSGSTFVFIDEGLSVEGGGVGVLELTAPEQETVLPTLEKTFRPTALEIYQALAPKHADAPERLVEAHRSLAAAREDVTAEPRQLGLNSARTSNLVGGLESNWCSDSATFQNNFHNWFYSGMGYAHEGYGLDLIWNKIGVTGVAARRALAACNNPLHTPFASETPVKVKIEAQLGANLWIYVAGTSRTLANQAGMYYLSEGFAAQRYRIVAHAHPWAIYNLAGAWGKK